MRIIRLPDGYVAVVDASDYERIARQQWRLHKGKNGTLYAARMQYGDGKPRMIMMHHEVLGTNAMVDHANCDGLDNRRANLRLCTNAQNSMNRRKLPGMSSRFKGVKRAAKRRWEATITIDSERIHLGSFASAREAAQAYDAAALNLFGEFARTNAMLGLLGAPKVLSPAEVIRRLLARSTKGEAQEISNVQRR